MAINATVDGTTYEGITKISSAGPDINLSYYEEGGDLPQEIAEIMTGSEYQESMTTSGMKSFSHGCTGGAPDIIIMWSDYRTRYKSGDTAQNAIIVGASWYRKQGYKTHTRVPSGYAGTNTASTFSCKNISDTSNYMIDEVTDTTFSITTAGSRRIDAGLTYRWIAIRLA